MLHVPVTGPETRVELNEPVKVPMVMPGDEPVIAQVPLSVQDPKCVSGA